MKIFINDKPIKITGLNGQTFNSKDFNVVLNSKDEINSKRLEGKILVYNATFSQLERFLKLCEVKKLKKLESITFQFQDEEGGKQFVKDHFKIIKASGGVVVKGDKILMIYRLKKWDLPKGKLKKNEDAAKGAKREVEEECNIKVEIKEKIGSTWHTYTQKGKRILKKTIWYEMVCLDDTAMKPQLKEFIEEVKWMERKDVKKALKNSYKSIEHVFDKYSKDYIS
ncbi:MAG: NUDIX hydrolase [Cytophagaceae bacterium]|nr:NUDIX hydrolase [Cytophagaceae bacterium]